MEPSRERTRADKFSMENYDQETMRMEREHSSDYVRDHKEKKVSDFEMRIKSLSKKVIEQEKEWPPQ